jgi:hypothetical protein
MAKMPIFVSTNLGQNLRPQWRKRGRMPLSADDDGKGMRNLTVKVEGSQQYIEFTSFCFFLLVIK